MMNGSNQSQGFGGQHKVPSMEVRGNKMYLNSRVWRGNNANSPYSFYGRWYVSNRRQPDSNSLRVVFFTKDQNHPIANASKGDILRFDKGSLRIKTERIPNTKDEKVVYAEVIVHEQLSVEHVNRSNNRNTNAYANNAPQQPREAPRQPREAPQGNRERQPASTPPNTSGEQPIF